MFPTEKSTFFGGLAEPGCLFPPTSPPVSQIYDNFHPGNSCIPKKFLYTKCCTWSRGANEILLNFFGLLYSMASEQPCVPLTWILFWPQMWEIFLFGKINFYAYCSILKLIMDGCLLWTVCLFVFCIFFAVLFAGRLRPARSSRKFKPTREGGCLDETWAGVTSLSQLGANRKTPSSTIAGATVTDIGGRWVLSGSWLKWTLWHSFPMQYGWWTTLLKNYILQFN